MNASPGAGPRLYRPRPALANNIEFFGYWEKASGNPHRSRDVQRRSWLPSHVDVLATA